MKIYTASTEGYDGTYHQAVPVRRLDLGIVPNPTRAARSAKWRYWETLGFDPLDGEISVWIDANMQIVGPVDFLELLGDADFALFRHGQRTCVWEEAVACIGWRKDDERAILRQMLLFDAPRDAGLSDTGVVIRRDTPAVRQLCADVQDVIECGSVRDQLAFDHVARQFRDDIRITHIETTRFQAPWLKVHAHSIG